MGFETKTLEELAEIEKDEYRARIRTPDGEGPDLSDGSDYDIEAHVHAVPVFGNQAHAEYLVRQVLPDTADQDFLERHADLRGVTKRRAAAAAGRVHIALGVGVAPLTQASGSEIKALDGRKYTLQEAGVVQLPTWTGKTVRAGATISRIQVAPDVSGMARGHRVSIGGVQRTIVRVLTSIQAIEVDPPFATAPSVSTAITAVAGAFPLVQASATGLDGNQEPGTTGTLSSPTTGLSATVEFVEMTGGADDETPDELRRDTLSVMAVHPGSGNLEQWRRWTLETPNVGLVEAFVYPGLRGLGTTTVLPFGPVDVRQVGEERNAEILAYLRQQCTAQDDVQVLQFSWMGTPQTFRMTIVPGRGYEPDVDTGGAPIDLHGSTASTTTRLQLANAADLTRFQVGDRVVVPITVSGLPTTEERVVRSVQNVGTGDYRLELLTALSAAPATSEQIYSGGPLYSVVYDALKDYFDTLGPGDTVPASRWPASVDTYQGDIIRSETIRRVKAVTGVRDLLTLTEPSANVATPPLFVQRLGQVRILWSS